MSNLVRLLEIPYIYYNADQVQQMKDDAVSGELWNKMTWGSYGPDGKGPGKVQTLGECDTDHLEAILITQPQVLPPCRAAILELLKKRYSEQN